MSEKPARVSVPVSFEVLEAFKRVAKVSNQSTGKAIAGWLEDTVDAANYMAQSLEKARSAPHLVARELHAYALGLTDETSALIDQVREKGKRAAATDGARDFGRGGPIPPSCNTGGKVPQGKKRAGGGKSS